MKHARHMILLKLLSIVATGLYIYAPIVIFRTAFFRTDGGLISVTFFAGVIIFGLLIKHKLSAVISWSLILLPILASYFVYINLGGLRVAYEVLPAILAYALSLKAAGRDAFQISCKPNLYAGFFVLAGCLLVTYYAKPMDYLKAWMFGASYFYILVYLIIDNQRNIDQNIFDKRYVEKSVLPANLRRFNLLSVTVIFLVFVLLYNFKAIVAYILKVLGHLVVLIIKGIGFIVEKLFTMEPIKVPDGIAEQGNHFLDEGASAMNPVIELLLNIIVCVVIIYVLYRVALNLKRDVPKLIGKLGGWIRKLFSLQERGPHIEAFDYVDLSEITRPEPKAYRRKAVRKVRKGKREVGAIDDPAEKVRFMYSLFLRMIKAFNIELRESDTTNDILKRTEDSLDISDSLAEYTSIYNQVRYGGVVPDIKMMSDAQGFFNEIANELRDKGKALPHKPYKTIEKEVVKSYNKDQHV